MLEPVPRMEDEREHLEPPVLVEAEPGAEPDAPHAGSRRAVGRTEETVVVTLRSFQMEARVDARVVALLIHDEPVTAGVGEAAVCALLPHLHLHRYVGHF